MGAPMLPDSPSLVAGPHCQALVWINDPEELRQDMFIGPKGEFKDAKAYVTPQFDDHIGYLNDAALPSNQERYVRMRAWWAGNDPRRSDAKSPLTNEQPANLLQMAKLLHESEPSDRLMKAEIWRELG